MANRGLLIWPASFRQLSKRVLSGLEKEEFDWILEKIRIRARKRGRSKRSAQTLKRELIRKRQGIKVFPELKEHRPSMFFAEFRNDEILDSIISNRRTIWIRPTFRKLSGKIDLSQFSFIDNPSGTLNMLEDLAIAECELRAGIINFEDLLITDISPYVVFGIIRKNMAPFGLGGRIKQHATRVIEAVDLRSFMNMKEFTNAPHEQDVWAFPLKQRYASGKTTSEPQYYLAISKVADDLVSTVDGWLERLPVAFELTDTAKANIAKIVTETLENAERHGRIEGDGDWYIAGFMTRVATGSNLPNGPRQHDSDSSFLCNIAIVNLGETFADTLGACNDPAVQALIQRYLNLHRRNSRNQSEATLLTALAMQDGISAKPESHGGVGMMSMVEFTNQLGFDAETDIRPSMTVISGASCVRFDGPYCGCRRNEDGFRVQAFNADQSLDSGPDQTHIFDLDKRFPGTIVSIRFVLDHKVLERLTDAHGSGPPDG